MSTAQADSADVMQAGVGTPAMEVPENRVLQHSNSGKSGSDSSHGSSSPTLVKPVPKSCPPHGAKQTLGVRSAMEDSYIAIPNFVHVNMQENAGVQEKWPTRLADSLPNSPMNSGEYPIRPAPSEVPPPGTAPQTDSNSTGSGSPSGSDSAPDMQSEYSDTFHFFGVFDGHGGAAAAAHCTSHLHRHFLTALRQDKHKAGGEASQSADGDTAPSTEQGQAEAGQSPHRKSPVRSTSRLEVFDVPAEDVMSKAMPGLLSISNDGDAIPGLDTPSDPMSTSTTPTPMSTSTTPTPAAVQQLGNSDEPGSSGEQPSVSKETHPGSQKTAAGIQQTNGELRTPCGAQLSPISLNQLTQAVSGPISGHYIEGVSTVQDLEQALTSAFLRTDAEFNQTDGADHTGSTAVTLLVGSRHICVANCGDSRAIMLRSDGVVALTDDHKPDREDEKDRVEAAGGQILYWNGRRVMGVLAMSRAIGDQCLQPYVIPDPEITILQRREDDELIIMGSDGIWDVLSNEETCQLAKRALNRARSKGANARAAAKVAATVLTRAALAKGSRDNITVIVVDLRPPEACDPAAAPASASSGAGDSKVHTAAGVARGTSPGPAKQSKP